MRAAVFASLVALVAAGCAGAPARSTETPQPSPSVVPVSSSSPSETPETSPIVVPAEVPFTLTFPDGWVSGTPGDVQAYLEDLATTDPALAAYLMENLQLQTSGFVAFEVSSTDPITPNVGCVTQDAEGTPAADLLDLAEQQNVEAIAGLPGTTVAPTADRVELPMGEAVRVRWQSDLGPPAGVAATVGYLFVSGDLVVTCVFTSAVETVDEHEPEWREILATFELP